MKKRVFVSLLCLVVFAMVSVTGCSQYLPKSLNTGAAPAAAANDDLKQQVSDIKGALPKFAIPMREIGSRFSDMYFAAKGGNWGLAAYMSKYMNAAMNPAKITKPNEYKAWTTFYTTTFDPVNKAIQAKDFAAFDKAYTTTIDSCNGCHSAMGYTFIKQQKPTEPKDPYLDYSLASEPTAVPK